MAQSALIFNATFSLIPLSLKKQNLFMKLLFIISILALFSLSACKKDKTSNDGNLISNPGFENNGTPDFSDWTGTKAFSNDVPPDGGKWSLQLVPEWYPAEGYAETFVTSLSRYYTFQFSCETKAQNGTGRIIIRKKDQDGTIKDLSKMVLQN